MQEQELEQVQKLEQVQEQMLDQGQQELWHKLQLESETEQGLAEVLEAKQMLAERQMKEAKQMLKQMQEQMQD